MKKAAIWPLGGLIGILAVPALDAQVNSARLAGTVRDSGGAAVAFAQVSLLAVSAVSDSSGRFLLAGLPGGDVTLYVRRMGFEPLERRLELALGRTDSVTLVLVALPQPLTGVTTAAAVKPPLRMSDFERHRQGRSGYYLDRKEIEERRVQRLSDLLRRMPGVRVMNDRSGRLQVRMTRASGSRDCPPDFWVDGIRTPFLNVDDIRPADMEALEIYKSATGLPPEYLGRFGNPACGAIVIWTRLPG